MKKSLFNCFPSNSTSEFNLTRLEENQFVCEVESWCPIEQDPDSNEKYGSLIEGAENFTVFIKNSIAIPYFGEKFIRDNMIGSNGTACVFQEDAETGENNGCQIFHLGEMISKAKGNFSR